MAMWAALVLAPLQMVIGDAHGRNTLRHQPTKLAAMEGLWDTGPGVAGDAASPGRTWQAERNLFAIEIPQVAQPLSDA